MTTDVYKTHITFICTYQLVVAFDATSTALANQKWTLFSQQLNITSDNYYTPVTCHTNLPDDISGFM